MLRHPFYDPLEVLIALGPALLGLPAVALLAVRGRHLFIVVGFLAMTGLYLLNLFFPVPLGWRFLLFAAVFLQLALVWWVLQSAPAWRAVFVSRERALLAEPRVLAWGGLMAVMVTWNVALAGLQFLGFQILPGKVYERYGFLQPVYSDTSVIAEALPPNAVVIGRTDLTWPLPTFRGKVVATLHPNPMVTDGARREADVRHFFAESTSNADRRGILARYGATHILYRQGWGADILPELERLGDIVLTHKNYVLIRVDTLDSRSSRPGEAWDSAPVR
jgi:hypothetical protein